MKNISLIPILLLLSPAVCGATGTIEANYRTTMQAYEEKDWERAQRLATVTLEQIESQAWKDWVYRSDKHPTVGYFTGDLVYMTMSEEQPWWQNQVEIYDPLGDRLVQVNDYKPWRINESLHTRNYTLSFLSRSEYLGYKIIWFEAGKPETERVMLRDKIEGFIPLDITRSLTSIDRTIDSDHVVICEKGPEGWALSIFDPATGVIVTVHNLTGIDITKDARRQVKLHRGADHWTFLDGDKVYALTPGTWQKRSLYTLPFTVAGHDHFRGDPFLKLAAVRGDTLYMLRETTTSRFELRTARLPFALSAAHWTGKIDFDGSGAWFAQSDTDSLRIFEIVEGTAHCALTTPSCVGRAYLIIPELVGTFWKGDTLIHFGPSGLKIFKGPRRLHSFDASGMWADYVPEREMLISYRAPGAFSVFDINNLEIKWKREFAVPQLEFFDVFDDDYLLINHIDGMSLLDIETGEELLQVSGQANLIREVNRNRDRILLGGDNFLGMYEIPNPQKYKGDLVAVTALSKWAAQDTAGALRDVRWALSSGMTLSGDLPESILAMLQSLDLKKEATNLMGKMAIRTNDDTWKRKLRNEGMEFLVQPNIAEFNAIFKLDEGILSFPALIYPFSVARGEDRSFYWFEPPDYDTELMMLPVCGFSITREHLLMFEYRVDETGENIVWYPILCNESIDTSDLGPLITTPVADNSENQIYLEYAVEKPPFNSYTNRRAITEICLRRGGVGGSSDSPRILYTAGIDLTGSGKNWYDSTLVDPVRIGNRYFAHSYYGDPITKIVEGSQADSIGMKVGDIVVSFGGYPIRNTTPMYLIKMFYPDRHPVDITVLRGADTLSFTVLNGRIGYEHWYSHKLVEIDPETGRHITEFDLPHLFGIKGYNSSGELIYTWGDTLLFFDPLSLNEKRVIVAGIDGYRRFLDDPDQDILILRENISEKFVAIDISKTADDADRVLWRETIENPYRLYGEARYPYSGTPGHFPAILEDGTLAIHDMATGSVIARENLPFRNFGLLPQIWDGILYGTAAGKIFGLKIAYYHPPFPWKYAGYGAAAFVPILLLSIIVNRNRIERLKKRQKVELKRAEIDAEISAARRLQAGLIPIGTHELGAFRLVGKFIPASEVAGDYFDFRLLDDGRLIVVIGDVAGHGLPAGILVSMAKASLITLSRNGDTDLTYALESLNEVVRNGSPESMFMTICYLIIDPDKRKIRCSANGHPFPLIARRDGSCEEIGDSGGYPLGVREKQTFQITEADFEPGDTLLVYTDGIPEQMNAAGDPWGYENFSAAFCDSAARKNLEEMVDVIFKTALDYTDRTGAMEDDMALMAIRYKTD